MVSKKGRRYHLSATKWGEKEVIVFLQNKWSTIRLNDSKNQSLEIHFFLTNYGEPRLITPVFLAQPRVQCHTRSCKRLNLKTLLPKKHFIEQLFVENQLFLVRMNRRIFGLLQITKFCHFH